VPSQYPLPPLLVAIISRKSGYNYESWSRRCLFQLEAAQRLQLSITGWVQSITVLLHNGRSATDSFIGPPCVYDVTYRR